VNTQAHLVLRLLGLALVSAAQGQHPCKVGLRVVPRLLLILLHMEQPQLVRPPASGTNEFSMTCRPVVVELLVRGCTACSEHTLCQRWLHSAVIGHLLGM
jgi:hypothetical protein